MRRLDGIARAFPEPAKLFLRPIYRAFLSFAQEINATRSNRESERIHRASARLFFSLRGRKRLKLNLACGILVKPSWVNIDLSIPSSANTVLFEHPDTVLINHDLRGGLPLDDESCDYIYSSHFFEHLDCDDGIRLMRECYDKLSTGGIFRMALPNFRLLFEKYLANDSSLYNLLDQYVDEMLPGLQKTMVDYVNFGVYQYGQHKCIYDEDRVVEILTRIGYSSAIVSSYREGIDEDLVAHRRYSFYVEAVK